MTPAMFESLTHGDVPDNRTVTLRAVSLESLVVVPILDAVVGTGAATLTGVYRGRMFLDNGVDGAQIDDISGDPAGGLAAIFQSQNIRVDAGPTLFHSWMWVYRNLGDFPGATLTLPRGGGHWNPNTTVTVVGTATAEVLALQEPADLAELLAYTHDNPPTVASVLDSTTFTTPSPGTLAVDVTGLTFFGIRLTNMDAALSGADEGYHALAAPASLA